MDRFSELIEKGVASFNPVNIANDSTSCPICRSYNNIFSMATDTHMSCLNGDVKIITGHIIRDYKKFDRFMWSNMFNGVDFTRSGVWSFSDWMNKIGLKGHYEVVNCDLAYIVEPMTDDETEKQAAEEAKLSESCIQSFVVGESLIPQQSNLLSINHRSKDVMECLGSTMYETAKNLNESKDVNGNNWCVANLSEGMCIVGNINGKAVKFAGDGVRSTAINESSN